MILGYLAFKHSQVPTSDKEGENSKAKRIDLSFQTTRCAIIEYTELCIQTVKCIKITSLMRLIRVTLCRLRLGQNYHPLHQTAFLTFHLRLLRPLHVTVTLNKKREAWCELSVSSPLWWGQQSRSSSVLAGVLAGAFIQLLMAPTSCFLSTGTDCVSCSASLVRDLTAECFVLYWKCLASLYCGSKFFLPSCPWHFERDS